MPRRPGQPADPTAVLAVLGPAWAELLAGVSEVLEVSEERILAEESLFEDVAFERASARVRAVEKRSQRLSDVAAGIQLDVNERTVRRRIQKLRQ